MNEMLLEQRVNLWQMLHALDCFQHVGRVCSFIQDNAITNGHPLYHSLLTSLYVLYGRPFKKSHGVGRLPDDIVPKELRHIHDDLILHRDKIFAHTDVNGTWEEEDMSLNQVELTVQNGLCSWRIRTVQPMPERVKEFQSLCTELVRKIEYHINKINGKVERHIPHTNGIYRLVLDPKASSAFQPEQNYGGSNLCN